MSPWIDDGQQLQKDRRQIRSCISAEAVLCSSLNLYSYLFFPSWTLLVSQSLQSALFFFCILSSAMICSHCFKIYDSMTLAEMQSQCLFSSFQLWISPAILCYIGSWGKRLPFMMWKLRGSSDIFVIMQIPELWPEGGWINTFMTCYWDGAWLLQNQTGMKTASLYIPTVFKFVLC